LQECTKDIVDKCKGFPVSFSPLQNSIKQLESAASKIYKEKKVKHDVSGTEMCN
jgi:N-acetylated-alpha-linked acidic dipeptidase